MVRLRRLQKLDLTQGEGNVDTRLAVYGVRALIRLKGFVRMMASGVICRCHINVPIGSEAQHDPFRQSATKENRNE